MQLFSLSSALVALAGLASVSASSSGSRHPKFVARQAAGDAPVPLTPNQVNEGQPLLIQWTPTTNDAWKSMEIKFMTGSNQHMTELATIASKVDGTAAGGGKLQWTAPAVNPNAKIYFFQFTHNDQEPTWTTRFAIADASGKVVDPPEANQPEGGSPAIPWGTGAIEGAVPSAGAADGSSSSSSGAAASTSAASSSAAPTSAAPTSTASRSGSASASASTATSSGIDFSKFNSGNQPSSASSSFKVASAAAVVGSAVFGVAALALL
ncbi:uncharacterized protein PFL1_03368 [Pseudozyma flocculosa PF-1]|uniref:Yeast cell wall synthesis Kre9/Knh1-like N-terminal domain-containing protein n=2 Tax=Pseudozyma flocculosa TaxID=84751 RepID=A0A5C3F6C7_9BASI|nr:uncharacterized protein PFL1_03368 [Pseudozyma flocculosa PF-1]EPQ29079.1 hypothetical protein PFL1_03368 [Pseudozyma flocculosa PF-1]SPO40073.1 uncharacterized protein PSFLO_05555 [Pseudozyma flocculosa]